MSDNSLHQKFKELRKNLTELEAEFLAAHAGLSAQASEDTPEAQSEQHAKTLLFYESVLGVITPTNAKLEEVIIEE